MSSNPRLLIVDDDEPFRSRLGRAVERRGFAPVLAADLAAAREALRAGPGFLAVLLDLRLPDGVGLELLDEIWERSPNARVVVLTGYGSIATAVEAVRRGAVEYLQKPVDAGRIVAALRGTSEERSREEAAAPSLARVEWEHLQRVLSDCGGNISEASRRLGIHRRSLQRKLQKYPPKQ